MKVNIETTNICNARCVMCPCRNMERKQGFMKLDLLNKILSELPNDVQEVCLSLFGEPLVDKRTPDILKIAREKIKTKIMFFTNGSLLGNWVNEAIYKYLDKIIISFQGWNKTIYEKNMKLDFDKSLKNIKDFLKGKPKKLDVNVLMLDMNYSEVEKSYFTSIFGLLSRIYPARNWDTYQTGENGFKIFCGRPNSLNILWDGTVIPCCRDYEATTVLGNLNKQTIQEVWEDKANVQLRNMFKSGHKPLEICKRCFPT